MKLIYSMMPLIVLFSTNTFSMQKHKSASAWSLLAKGTVLKRKDLTDLFMKDCVRDQDQNNLIPSVKNENTVRIATYNIHLWRPPHHHFAPEFDYAHNENFDAIMKNIKAINAHVLILQEMLIFDWKIIKKTFENLGYEASLNNYVQSATYYGYPMGTMIFSKIKSDNSRFNKTYKGQVFESGERQGFIKTAIEFPHNQKLVLYSTHLDVHDDTEQVRYAQVQELLEYASQETEPCIVAADFNAVRARDYQYHMDNRLVWKLLNEEHAHRVGFDTPTKALDLFEKRNFTDCFAKAGLAVPYYSVWNGTVVDFLWLNKQWNFQIDGCYVYYSSASDHLPIIMDIQI